LKDRPVGSPSQSSFAGSYSGTSRAEPSDGGGRMLNAEREDPLLKRISALRYSIGMCPFCARKPKACPACQRKMVKISNLQDARAVWLSAQARR
jgi:hypothetical protein